MSSKPEPTDWIEPESTDGTEPDPTDGTEPESTDGAGTGEESFLGALSIIGAISFCCIGLGTVVGTAALAGGLSGTTVAIGAASARGSVISALVTALTVVAVALVARWYYN